MARKGVINRHDTANQVLAGQPEFGYPILLFIREKTTLRFSGRFEVSGLEERSVVIRRLSGRRDEDLALNDPQFIEGDRWYVTHLVAERSRAVIDLAKKKGSWACEVCGETYQDKYGFAYVEAHHKTPIETFQDEHAVRPSDLALLCPNCHKAIHLSMKSGETDFAKLRSLLKDKLGYWKPSVNAYPVDSSST